MPIPKIQSGYGYRKGEHDLQRYDGFPVKLPKGREVLLEVKAVGLCQSDLHVLHKLELDAPDEFIMGHEIAGQIVAVGEELEDHELYQVGGRFAIFICNACGECQNCRLGNDNGCTVNLGDAYGLLRDGGFQQFLLVDNLRNLVEIPDGVSYEDAAVTLDAVLTPFHAIMRARDHLKPKSKVLVVGLGGLGVNAVQILKNFGVYVVVVDIKEENRQLAMDVGADEFWTDPVDLDHLPESFEACFDFCGIQETSDSCQMFVKWGGVYLTVGLGRLKLFLMNFHLGRREIKVLFNMGGTLAEQREAMEWVADGRIKPIKLVMALSELPEYFDKLKKGQIKGRAVFLPSKL